jgi:autotransporter-associated beta strand protein
VTTLATFVALATAFSAVAGSATWRANATSGIWTSSANWSPSVIPNGPSDLATFGSSQQTAISIPSAIQVAGITFSPGASAFAIAPASTTGTTLTIGGTGIQNQSSVDQNFLLGSGARVDLINGAVAGDRTKFTISGGSASITVGGVVAFLDDGSAGRAAFVCDGGSGEQTFGAVIQFRNKSTAADATFVTLSGSGYQAYGGRIWFGETATAGNASFSISGGQTSFNVEFDNFSSAGTATLTVNGGDPTNVRNGSLLFWHSSTAANATIIVNGAGDPNFSGGTAGFGSSASAGNATLIANPSLANGRGGTISFSGNSVGGSSRLVVNSATAGNYGSLEIGGHAAPGLTIGSLEGGGVVFLGARKLTIGSRHVSTTFTGEIRDGGSAGYGQVGGALAKIGIGRLVLTGANTYTGGTTVEAGTLLANNTTGSATGPGPIGVSGAGTTFGGTGTVAGPVTINAGACVQAGDGVTATGSLTLGNDLTLLPDSVIKIAAGPAGAHSVLARTGGTWRFAGGQQFALLNFSAEPGIYDNIITGLSGDPGGTEAWTITNAGFAGIFSYDGAGNIDLTVTAAPGSIGNVSTRLPVGAGDDVLIQGFIVQGPPGSSKKIIVRAMGPSLAAFGINDALLNPTLALHDSSGATVATNDDWKTTQVGGLITVDQSAEINNSGVAPGNDSESAIIADLAPGSYTAVVRGLNNSTGTGLVDAYDLSGSSPAKLVNIATRGLIQGGDKLMIAGFIVQNAAVQAVVRAIGPSLLGFGITSALADTTLQLRDQNGAIVLENDNWRSSQEQELEDSGLQPSHDLEAALVTTIQPGSYTAQVRGKNDSAGIGVVEVYFLK